MIPTPTYLYHTATTPRMSPSKQLLPLVYPCTASPTSDINTSIVKRLQRSISHNSVEVSPPPPQSILLASNPHDITHLLRGDILVPPARSPSYSLSTSHFTPTLSISSSDLARPIHMSALSQQSSLPPAMPAISLPLTAPPPQSGRQSRKPRARKAPAPSKQKPAKRARKADEASPLSSMPPPCPC